MELYTFKNSDKGIRLHFEKGVNDDVRGAIIRLVKWLRKQYYFPVRVNVYVKSSFWVKASDGDYVRDLFFWPEDRSCTPYITIGVGDYEDWLKTRDRDDALAPIVLALLCELTNYFNWVNGVEKDENSLQKSAWRYARKILNLYAEVYEHP